MPILLGCCNAYEKNSVQIYGFGQPADLSLSHNNIFLGIAKDLLAGSIPEFLPAKSYNILDAKTAQKFISCR